MTLRGYLRKDPTRIPLSEGLECDKCGRRILNKELRQTLKAYESISTYRVIDNWVVPCFICFRCRAELAKKDIREREK